MILATENYQCPLCGIEADETKTLLSKTKNIFTGDEESYNYEPGYVWVELHKCNKCKCLYYMSNGT